MADKAGSSSKKKRTQFSIAVPINFEENADAAPRITGFGIHPGLFNDIVEVPDSELDNMEQTIKTAKFMANHDDYNIFSIMGRVTGSEKIFDEKAGKMGVKYEAEVDQDDPQAMLAYNKVKNGYIDATSVGFYHDSECSICGEDFFECEHWFWDGAHVIARNCECFEISLVPFGADSDATATTSDLGKKKFVNNFKKQFEKKFMKFEGKKTPLAKGGKEMVKENPKNQTIDAGELVSQLADARADIVEKGKEIQKLQQKIADATGDEDALQKANDKIDQLEKDLKTSKDAFNKINGNVKKEVATGLAEREIAVGLVKEEDKDTEIENLSKANDETIDKLSKTLDVLEFQKKEQKKLEDNGQKQGKVPKLDNLQSNTMHKGAKRKFTKEELQDGKLIQAMVHTVFNYGTVFEEDDRVVDGHTYMGKK
jgi:phage head maturation protease